MASQADRLGDEFDLLGLSTPSAPQVTTIENGSDTRDQAPSSRPRKATNEEPVISYPSAYQQDVSPTPDRGSQDASEVSCEKRYTVRCEGRWRVRSAPSLNSKVVGTISNGTIVHGEDCHGEISGPSDLSSYSGTQLTEAQKSITGLWVRVLRLEAQEPMGVSEIKRDSATGGELYCLRRNAMGFGLYQLAVEPLDGPLVTLPEALALELRLDAQRAASDKTEDVSLTWKLLGAAESFGKLFSYEAGGDEGGINEDIKPTARRRPEDMFEVKQREQLKKAASSLRAPTEKLVNKASEEGAAGDLLAGLQKDLARRYARLRRDLFSSTFAVGSLVVTLGEAVGDDKSTGSPMEASASSASSSSPAAEGSIEELQTFIQTCERLERTGGWSGLGPELRLEVINFSAKHAVALTDYVRLRCKGVLTGSPTSPGLAPASPSSTFGDNLLGDLISSPPPSGEKVGGRGGYGNAAPSAPLPFLPPPPSSTFGVGNSRLV